jgi:hypothetical protein
LPIPGRSGRCAPDSPCGEPRFLHGLRRGLAAASDADKCAAGVAVNAAAAALPEAQSAKVFANLLVQANRAH